MESKLQLNQAENRGWRFVGRILGWHMGLQNNQLEGSLEPEGDCWPSGLCLLMNVCCILSECFPWHWNQVANIRRTPPILLPLLRGSLLSQLRWERSQRRMPVGSAWAMLPAHGPFWVARKQRRLWQLVLKACSGTVEQFPKRVSCLLRWEHTLFIMKITALMWRLLRDTVFCGLALQSFPFQILGSQQSVT